MFAENIITYNFHFKLKRGLYVKYTDEYKLDVSYLYIEIRQRLLINLLPTCD